MITLMKPKSLVKFMRAVLTYGPGTAVMLYSTWNCSIVIENKRYFVLFDDAQISMTYARTFAETGNWVWYPGAPRVQGFTNPLWTLYMAFLHKIGIEGSNVALLVSLTGITLVVASAEISRRALSSSLVSLPRADFISRATAFTITLLFPLVFWSSRGMEVGLLAFLTLVLLCLYLRLGNPELEKDVSQRLLILMSIVMGAGVWTRFDFLVICATLCTILAVERTSTLSRVEVVLRVAGPLSFMTVVLLVFQRVYWGSTFPNTYYLKVYNINFVERLTRGILSASEVLPMVFMAVALLVLWRQESPWSALPRLSRSVLLMFSAMLAYSIWVGGDTFSPSRYTAVVLPGLVLANTQLTCKLHESSPSMFGRYITIVGGAAILGVPALGIDTNPRKYLWPGMGDRYASLLLIIGVAIAGSYLWAQRSRPRDHISIFVVPILVALLSLSGLFSPTGHSFKDLVVKGSAGQRLDQLSLISALTVKSSTYPDATVAVMGAGIYGYFSDRKLIDLLGKSDPVIARQTIKKLPYPHVTSSFFPGHSKWDFDYSIGVLRPDVVAGTWGTAEIEDKLAAWGYEARCFGPVVRFHTLRGSPRVIDVLPRC